MSIFKTIGASIVRLGMAATLAVAPVMMTACSTTLDKSYTFVVDTGDNIKVTVDMKGGHDLSQDGGTFEVANEDGDSIVSGTFMEVAQFDTYKDSMEDGKFNGEVESVGDDLLIWSYASDSGTEHNRFVKVSDKTAVLMGSIADGDEAKKAYDAISFEVVEDE